MAVNPFSKQLKKDFLFNIKTSTKAPQNVEKYILTLFKEMYLCLNVSAHLSDLLNLLTRQPLLPLLAGVLKEKIHLEK